MNRFCISALCGLFLACTMAAQAANPVPFVDQPLVPTSAAPGISGFRLTLHGTGFVATSVVKWNGSARTTTFVSSSELQATILSSDVASAGSASITVNSGGADSDAVVFWIAPPASSISFGPSQQLLNASAPIRVITADLNADGKTDVALANGFSSLGSPPNIVGVLLGNGNGTFEKPVDYKTASLTIGVATGDFNADGHLDLVVSGQLTHFVTSVWAFATLLGNGDGTFQPSKYKAANFRGGSDLAIGDFNRDGNLDVIATDTGSIGNIAVALGNGDGTFTHFVTSLTCCSSFTAMGDLNGDGILDLAGTSSSGPAFIALGKGDGSFQTPTELTSGSLASAVVLGDFNGDGKLDIAFEGVTSLLSVCLGNGDGTFRTCVNYPDDPNAGNTGFIHVADLNADGKLDIILTHNDNSFAYFLGNGDGTFQPFTKISISDPMPGPAAFAIGDLNGDGRADIVFIGGSTDNSNLGLYRLLQHP
jgi:hypothetical protein